MKIILTLEQLKKVLASEPVHMPVTLQLGKITKAEIEELVELLKKRY